MGTVESRIDREGFEWRARRMAWKGFLKHWHVDKKHFNRHLCYKGGEPLKTRSLVEISHILTGNSAWNLKKE